MNTPATHFAPGSARRDRAAVAIVAGTIAIAAVAAYHNTWHVPFIFDDIPAIVENPTIRRMADAFAPPRDSGVTVNGRPFVNFSLALNHAIGGTAVVGYHVVNLTIHIAAAWALFGVVRRTLLLPAVADRLQRHATPLAGVIALLWCLHPLQTAAVTYVVQRAESLMALCYLLTLYCFIRGAKGGGRGWLAGAVVACAAGMATKEVMISAPLVVLFHDRGFIAGSFRAAWRERGRWHLALAATWLILAAVMLRAGDRGGSAGFGLGTAWWEYGLTQIHAVSHYLRLALWPDPLVLDYQLPVIRAVDGGLLMPALVLLVLAAATLVALWRRPRWGFLGLCFFALLAPSSSVVPLADTMFEHRMYLPLALVVTGVVVPLWLRSAHAAVAIGAVLGVALAWATVERNGDYESEESIWRDTVQKRPHNVRAHYTLGSILAAAGRRDEAFAEFQRALELAPDSADAHTNLGRLLAQTGRKTDAAAHLERAVRLRPGSPDARNNWGNFLAQSGRSDEARAQWEEAVRLRPVFPEALVNLGIAAAQRGDLPHAIARFETALRMRPDFVEARYSLGTALMLSGRAAEAIPHFEAVLRLQPDHAGARQNLREARAVAAGAPSSPKD